MTGVEAEGKKEAKRRRTALRSSARLAKALTLRVREWSSPKRASRRQSLRFSTPAQWPRIKTSHWAGGVRRAGGSIGSSA